AQATEGAGLDSLYDASLLDQVRKSGYTLDGKPLREPYCQITNQMIEEATGLSYATISAILNGRPNVQALSLAKVAAYLQVPLSRLFPAEPQSLDGLKQLEARLRGRAAE